MSTRRALSKPARNPSVRLALEPRIVFDGALPVAAADTAEHHDSSSAQADVAAARAVSFEAPRTEPGKAHAPATDAKAATDTARAVNPSKPAATEIVFVDAAVVEQPALDVLVRRHDAIDVLQVVQPRAVRHLVERADGDRVSRNHGGVLGG